MNIVVIGLTISSSWGNGHATTWRGLLRALARRGHAITFLEREQSWYASRRDLIAPDYCDLIFYQQTNELRTEHGRLIAEADAVIVSSYVPDGIAVCQIVLQMARGMIACYDIDTPVTLAALAEGKCEYLRADQISEFDLYLSFSGGPALDILHEKYHAVKAFPLYCSVDPEQYFHEAGEMVWSLGYLGTYSPDRQPSLEQLLLNVARQSPESRFVVAGPQYPATIDFPENVSRIDHLSPDRHRSFYNSQSCTLNITRADMRSLGFSPSVRLFEAAACGVPIISDDWPGLDTFFSPGEEILIVESTSDVVAILRDLPEAKKKAIGLQARDKVLRLHTAEHRAGELEAYLGVHARDSVLEGASL